MFNSTDEVSHLGGFVIQKILLACLFISNLAQGEVIGYFEMQPGDKLDVIPGVVETVMKTGHFLSEETVAVWDWDNTVSTKDGGNQPREGVDGMMGYFSQRKISSLVLTNRLKGLGLNEIRKRGQKFPESFVKTAVQKMYTDLNVGLGVEANIFQSSPFFPCSGLVQFKDQTGTFILLENILFGGLEKDNLVESYALRKSNKGYALAKVLDSEEAKKAHVAKLLVILDDMKTNLAAIGEIFQHRKEKVLLIFIHHPDTSVIPPNKDEEIVRVLSTYPKTPFSSPTTPRKVLADPVHEQGKEEK